MQDSSFICHKQFSVLEMIKPVEVSMSLHLACLSKVFGAIFPPPSNVEGSDEWLLLPVVFLLLLWISSTSGSCCLHISLCALVILLVFVLIWASHVCRFTSCTHQLHVQKRSSLPRTAPSCETQTRDPDLRRMTRLPHPCSASSRRWERRRLSSVMSEKSSRFRAETEAPF